MTRPLFTCSALFLLVSSTLALAPSNDVHQGRRAFFRSLGGAVVGTAAFVGSSSASSASVAKTGAASPWTGFYDDPNHQGCLRQVKVVGAPLRPNGTPAPFPIVEVRGYDGPEGASMCSEPPAKRDAVWVVKGELKNDKAVLDFSSKGGPSNLLATYEDGAIVFPDGNKWTKNPLGTPERLPLDMSTLKSN